MRQRKTPQEDSATGIAARCEVIGAAAYLPADNIRVRNTSDAINHRTIRSRKERPLDPALSASGTIASFNPNAPRRSWTAPAFPGPT